MHVRHPASGRAKLDADVVDFLQSGVSIVVTSPDDGGFPQLFFAAGCRVHGRTNRVRVFLAESRCPRLVQAVRATGRIAAVFSRPEDNRTLQLKGTVARVGRLTKTDHGLQSRYLDKLAASLATIGVARELVEVAVAADTAELVAVEFAPAAAFSQTPGPLAGRALPL